ncbi:hypothetical protein PHLH8_27890 [Pseudomonas sp. Pc102]|uniref:DUF1329 domain-containing protein n=1 Tax=Pseudomonas sp. Pc102 TaxID=2678261 RepID=UPI001BCDFBA3|nr:DUF1329 domain-containing protein [Pseudomonas sp. Pc102]BBP83147.1 hypothetical protein PHLH8_27890 [Pseudomonas sp. Pc102]
MTKPRVLSALMATMALAASFTAAAEALTPLGAEAAGNADGSIPAWTGGFSRGITWNDIPKQFVDPFAGDPVKFSIDASNYETYRDNLTPGQIEQLRRNPDGYRLNVYETRRTARYPEHVYEAARKNAQTARLAPGGNGVLDYEGYVPFSHPKSGVEVLWNHFMRYRGGSLFREHTQVITQPSGAFSEVRLEDRAAWPENLTGFDPVRDANIMIFSTQKVTAPARLAGNILLVHETVDQVAQPRLAWLYNSGQRRVRRAPQVAYDGPGTAADGLRTSDNYDMYTGSPDRYEWVLEGKQELYIPYNNYRLTSHELTSAKLIEKGHLAPEYLRYEKHRVWKVVGTLKPGMRHIYAKRVFYIDEDTWQIALAEHYDSRGELWRFSEGFHVQYDYADTPWYAGEAIYDFSSNRYLVFGLIYNSAQPITFGFKASKSEFTPAALRAQGIR